ncbi:hypothetical protein GPECTOR_1g440 [Gonium pectorale]|uniref:Uncharacterized protein n=1 Tax=Gonium pectorale TaxID=33097 RepID=A0A150H3C4_GONPE|nr:hypothetical protein GPECTOR_1g440 [Gonium pectorale]|eukprot:KXZ56492.1 hypothetical protein GPECTOR_1g440 [Gonium pectorale]
MRTQTWLIPVGLARSLVFLVVLLLCTALAQDKVESAPDSGLRSALTAGGATTSSYIGGIALFGSALLQPLTYALPDAQPVEVSGELLVAGSAQAAVGDTAPGTPPDGSRLHLRDLTLLLPAPSPDALAAAPASVLAHLITAAGSAAAADGGEDASPTAVSVLLLDVILMLPGDAELRAFMSRLCEPTSWRHRGAAQLRVLGGVVMYGNDTMQLAPPAPPAVLLRTNVTSRSASAAPWACSATAVSGADELRATAAELLAVTGGTVLLSLTGNVTIDPELGDWGPILCLRHMVTSR